MIKVCPRTVLRSVNGELLMPTRETPTEPEIGIPGRSEAEDCGICGDTPKTYGLQSGCDHIYCYDCLKSWRAVAADSRTCPTCRTKSEFIFPSSVYPYTPGKKTAPAITKPDTAEDNTDGTSSQDELSPVTDAQSNELSSNKSVSGRDKSQPEGTETTNGETKDTTTPASTENAGETSAATPQTKKRTRQKKKRACKNSSKIINDDPNPAKTRLLNNYLQKLKTIPCKFFCNPALSLKVQAWDEEQSICWTGSKRDGNSDRRIPFCKFGNHCRFSHPHPEKPLEEYIYDDWEIDMLRIKPQNVRGRNIDMWQNRPINDWGNVEVDPEFVQDLRLMGLAEDLLLDWGVVQ
ncbi:hypothetical protein DFH27DRAFT_158712 [Peziza echinospora]|nr:hypothetical protein DFH27DRAFT_158712 [Peziza echinospora]